MGCERHRRIQQIAINIPLFVFLTVVLPHLLSITALAAAAAPDDPYAGHIDREKTSPSQQTVNVVRIYKLHNRCSGKHVAVRGRVVQAKDNKTNKYAWLRVETYSFESLVRIRSNASHSYLCFNERGRLTVKIAGKGKRCLFTERHAANDYTEFQSFANPRWYLGFNRGGRRLAGDQWTKAKDKTSAMNCYQFIKMDSTPYTHTPTRSRPGSDASGSKGGPPSPYGSAASSVGGPGWSAKLDRRGSSAKRRRSSDDRQRAVTNRRHRPPK